MGPEDINTRYIDLKEKIEALEKEIASRDSNDPSLINMRSEAALLRNDIRKERDYRNNIAELSSKYTEYEAFYNRMQELYDAHGKLNNELSSLVSLGRPIPQELRDSIHEYEDLISEILRNSSIPVDLYDIPGALKDLAFKINKLNGITDPEVAKEDLEEERELSKVVELLQEEEDARNEKARIQREIRKQNKLIASIPEKTLDDKGVEIPNPDFIKVKDKLANLKTELSKSENKLTEIHNRNFSKGLDYKRMYTYRKADLDSLREKLCEKYEKNTFDETKKHLDEIIKNAKIKAKENNVNNPPLGGEKPASGHEPSSGKPASSHDPSSGKPAQGSAQGGKKAPDNSKSNLGGGTTNPTQNNNPAANHIVSDTTQNQEPKITMDATGDIYLDLLNFPQKPCTTNSTFSYIKKENIAGEAKLVYETEDIQKYLNNPRKHLKKLIKDLSKDETLMKITKEKDATLYSKLSKPRKLLKDIDYLTHDMQIYNYVALKSAVTPEQVADALKGKYPYDYKINYTKTKANPFSRFFRERILALDEYKRTAVDLHPVAKKDNLFNRANTEKEKAPERVPLRPKLKGRDDYDR